MISSLSGQPICPLGLAAQPDSHQDVESVPAAFESGINFFFFYSPGHKTFVAALRPLIQTQRDEVFVATGSGSRQPSGLRTARRKIFTALGAETIDVFFAEYIHPADDPDLIFGDRGVLDELDRWKAGGWIRFVGATAHDRMIAKRLANDARVDILMHRFNMAHRKAADEVFPAAVQTQTPVVAFTATRWATLLNEQPDWPGTPPSAVDCYRYCLAQPAVSVVLTAPRSVAELRENLGVLNLPHMSIENCRRWERFGDIVYAQKREADPYESRWP